MSNDAEPAGPPPGGLYDSSTGQMRWWNGTTWTEHVQPSAATAIATRYPGTIARPLRPLMKNGYARTATFVLGAVIVGIPALPLLAGVTPATQVLSTSNAVLLTLVGTAFAIVATVGVGRPRSMRRSWRSFSGLSCAFSPSPACF